MITIKLPFIFLIILFLFPLISFGQAKSISKEAFDNAIKEAQSNTEKRMRKVSDIEKRYKDNSLSETVTAMKEFVPPDKSKLLFIPTREKSDEKVKSISLRVEVIFIGDDKYKKTGSGDWVKSKVKSDNRVSDRIDGENDNSTKEYSMEEVKIGKEMFQVYTLSTVIQMREKYLGEYKTWIKDKLIYKTTSIMSLNKPKNLLLERVATYDYSSNNLKIEAPQMKSSGK